MKTKFTLAALLLLMLQTKAQNVENPSFDSIYLGGIDRIHAWITSDAWMGMSGDTVLPLTPSSHFVSVGLQYHELLYSVQLEYTNAFDGPYAIKVLADSGRIRNDGNAFRGFVVNGNHFYTDSSGYIDLAKCGEPFPYRPYLLRGHYKFEDHSPSLSNYPEAIVLLKKYNSVTQVSDTIGFGHISMPLFTTSTWRLFEVPINYFSNQVPDSIVVSFMSTALRFPSTFWVDSIGFDYNFPSIIDEPPYFEKDFYVNHSENKIYFTHAESIKSVKIYSVNGQLIQESVLQQPALDISALSKGVYIMNLEDRNNLVRTFKIFL
jgi:hypothetical protein